MSVDLQSDSEDWTEEGLCDFSMVEHSAWIRLSATTDAPDLTKWLVPVISPNATISLVARDPYPTDDDELRVGAIFDNKKHLNIVVGTWNMEKGLEFKVPTSDHVQMKFFCKHPNCPFELRATSRGTDTWIIRKFIPQHSCLHQLRRVALRKINMNVIAAFVAQKIRTNCKIMEPKAIIEVMLREFGITIRYDLALRARHAAIQSIYRWYIESFQLLPDYLHMLKESNPDTITDLEVGNDMRFEDLLVVLGVYRVAYPCNMRYVIILDGTHLKCKNRGILFVSMTKDSNKHVFPLAIGIGPIENDIS